MKTISVLFFCLFLTDAFGDGLRVKDGTLLHPHSVFDLSPSQREEIEALNTVTLTKNQWAELRKVSPGSPKRLDGLLPVDWDDMLDYVKCEGVILRDGRLAVLHRELRSGSIRLRLHWDDDLVLMATTNGDFFFRGIKLDFEYLLDEINTSESVSHDGPESLRPRATIELPPSLKSPHHKQITPELRVRLKRIYRALANKGWNKGETPKWLNEKLSEAEQAEALKP